jgi:hypothetical protein
MKKHSQLCSVEKLYLGLADLLTSFQVTVLLVVELGFATPPGLASLAERFYTRSKLHPLEDRGDALANADAHRCQAERAVAVDHRVQQCRGDPRPAGSQGVADGNRSAADVYFFLVEAEHLNARQRLRGERFVEFHDVDVCER